jgi:DtxR family Mn-dependent transcriptional regulator
MQAMTTPILITLLAGISGLALLFVVLSQRRLRKAHQLRREDALKAILTAELENRALSAPGLAGLLGARYETTIRLIEEMCSSGLVCWAAEGLQLTPTGRQTAIRLLRAHRLTERFLVDEARMALERVHREADRAEHAMSETQLAELNEQLGHPDWDPHGDPIPDARGEVAHVDRFPLDGWPLQRRAVVTHVEDEPPAVYAQLTAQGIRPGMRGLLIEKLPHRIRFLPRCWERLKSSRKLAGNLNVGDLNKLIRAPEAKLDAKKPGS